MKRLLLGLFLITACSSVSNYERKPSAIAPVMRFIPFSYGRDDLGDKDLLIRVGTYLPVEKPVGDIIYIHGFADRLDNHEPLFQAWTEAGLRVIAFDLPGHGENKGSYNDLNKFDFKQLMDLVVNIEKLNQPEDKRPLLISGWSTGGLRVHIKSLGYILG